MPGLPQRQLALCFGGRAKPAQVIDLTILAATADTIRDNSRAHGDFIGLNWIDAVIRIIGNHVLTGADFTL